MINKCCFIKVDKDNFNLNYLKNKCISKNFNEFENLLQDKKVRSKKIYILIEGEEAYIKNITIPRVKEKKIDKILNDELLYEFNDLNDILYFYQIKNKNKTSIDILMFCINISDKLCVKKFLDNDFNIKGVYLFQFALLSYYMKFIKDDKFKFLIPYKDYIYFIVCDEDKIIYNSIIRGGISEHRNIKKELLRQKFENYNKVYCVDSEIVFLKDILDEFEVIYLPNLDGSINNMYKNIVKSKVIA